MTRWDVHIRVASGFQRARWGDYIQVRWSWAPVLQDVAIASLVLSRASAERMGYGTRIEIYQVFMSAFEFDRRNILV